MEIRLCMGLWVGVSAMQSRSNVLSKVGSTDGFKVDSMDVLGVGSLQTEEVACD